MAMDATTRWETEAIRSSSRKRSNPPRPTAKRTAESQAAGTWVTLKEAETATGIPSNTLRKWVRKEAVDSYLESDGELSLRMIRLESVEARAKALGRTLTPIEAPTPADEVAAATPAAADPVAVEAEPAEEPSTPTAADTPEVGDGTMLVPIDAWNKMLSQLGNLHEAGQQLADARERAAKAETESTFLRERLAEMRSETEEIKRQAVAQPVSVTEENVTVPERDAEPVETAPLDAPPEPTTTTYWRYLTTGWRDRKRRSNEH